MHEWRKQETSCWKQLKPNYKIIIYWYSNKRKKKRSHSPRSIWFTKGYTELLTKYWKIKRRVILIQLDTTSGYHLPFYRDPSKLTINFSVTNCDRSISKTYEIATPVIFFSFFLSFFLFSSPPSDEIEPIAKLGGKVARGVIMPSIRKVILPSKWFPAPRGGGGEGDAFKGA